MSLTLEQLGLTTDGIREIVIDKISANVVDNIMSDGGEELEARVLKTVRERTENIIEERIDKVIGEAIEPRVADLVDNLVFQETNNWGEPKKPPMSLREKALHLAEQWMSEPVNYQGQTKKQESYNWRGDSTRIIHMVEKRIQFTIDEAVKAAVADLNSKVAGGIAAAVKQTMTEVLNKTKVMVTPPR
jgi:DNA replication initiation complex subunit (GINS family)